MGRDIVGLQLHPQAGGDGGIDLVPGQCLIVCDLECLADGMGIAHQAHIALGEVRIVGHGPQGRAVAVDDDGLDLLHPPDDLIAPVFAMHPQRDIALIIGMAGANDGHGEVLLPVGAHQDLLAGDLIPGILPVGIGQSGALGDAVVLGRLVIGGGGAGVQILPRPAGKQPDIPLHLRRHKADKLAHAVKTHLPQRRPDCRLVVHVRADQVHTLRHLGIAGAAVEQINLPPLPGQQPGHRQADGASAADQQCFHHITPIKNIDTFMLPDRWLSVK